LDDLEGARLQANEAQTDWQSIVADDAPPLYHGFLAWSPIPECWGKIRVAFAQAVAAEELKLRKEITWGKNTEAQEDSPRRAQRLAAIRRKVISRACVACDLLAIRRKRVSTHI